MEKFLLLLLLHLHLQVRVAIEDFETLIHIYNSISFMDMRTQG